MNSIKSFVKQNLQIILFVLCGILVVSGILTFVFGAGESDDALKVLFVILGVTIILLGASLALFSFALGSA